MKKITELTQAQKDRMPEWRDKWIDIGLNTEEADFETFKKYMEVAYNKAGIDWPNNTVIVQSPVVGALAAAIANNLLSDSIAVDVAVDVAVGDAVRAAVGDAVGSTVSSAVVDAVGSTVSSAVVDAVGDAVRAAVGDAVDGAVRADVNSAVRGAIDAAVRGAVRSAVRADVNSAVKNIKWHEWLGGQFWVGGWYGSPSYVSFFTEVCGLKLSEDITERAIAYQKICESVNYIWPNKQFVIVCNRPKVINRDNEGRLHCETGKSIEYRDGWGIYSWHGVTIPSAWIKNKESLTPQMALTWKNVEQRNAACQILGWGKILEAVKPKLIDRDKNPYFGELLEVDLPDHGKQKFLRAKCGTGRDVVVLANNAARTAREARAMSYGLSAEEYNPVVRS